MNQETFFENLSINSFKPIVMYVYIQEDKILTLAHHDKY